MVCINNNKLNDFKLTDKNFYVVMDFDSTITSSESLGSWSVLENPKYMDPAFQEESNKLLDKYYPIELNCSLDNETKSKYMEEWYTKNMDLFYKYGLTYTTLHDCVTHSNMKFRDGVKKFLKLLYKNNVPVIILSAGIGNVIVEALKLNKCFYDNIHIISNFIKFENNIMLPFSDDMIHSSNKSIDKLPIEARNKIKDKDYILLFGDLIEDLKMVHKEDLDKTISFGFLEKAVDKNFEYYKKKFDVVLTNNASFSEIEKLLKW